MVTLYRRENLVEGQRPPAPDLRTGLLCAVFPLRQGRRRGADGAEQREMQYRPEAVHPEPPDGLAVAIEGGVPSIGGKPFS